MPRITRAVIESLPYHITQRGNRREDIFFEDGDRKKYLEWLQEYSNKHGLKIWAYCLMTNHVHLVVVPQYKDSLEKVMRPLNMRYAQYINSSRQWNGHLWQGRFFSSILNERYLWFAVRYVELNPIRARIVDNAEDYPWSSAAAHCGKRKDNILALDFPPAGIIENWATWIRESERSEDEDIDILRRNTQKGLPCGNETFVAGLENRLDRLLRFRPPGRPRAEEGQNDKISKKGLRPLSP